MNEQESYEGWTLVEQLGHKRLAGYVRSVEIAGAGMLRVDVPTEPPLTQYLNPTSIYALTPITEDVARFLANNLDRGRHLRQVVAADRPMTKYIYLASNYSSHPTMQLRASELGVLGYRITSRWIWGDHEVRSGGQSDTDAWAVRFAEEDWADLLNADTVISFTQEPGKAGGRNRGGRHVEFGAALALGRRCIIVGWRENVFHHLPQVEFYATWEAALWVLMQEARP